MAFVPYVLMTKAEGTLLSDIWKTADDTFRNVVVKQMAEICFELYSLRLDGIGSVMESLDGSFYVRQKLGRPQ